MIKKMKIKETYQKSKWEIQRTLFPIILFIVMMFILFYVKVSSELTGLQLFLYKVGLANAGFLNAHIVRKFAFHKTDWEDNNHVHLKILIIVLYAMFIYVYAAGG